MYIYIYIIMYNMYDMSTCLTSLASIFISGGEAQEIWRPPGMWETT